MAAGARSERRRRHGRTRARLRRAQRRRPRTRTGRRVAERREPRRSRRGRGSPGLRRRRRAASTTDRPSATRRRARARGRSRHAPRLACSANPLAGAVKRAERSSRSVPAMKPPRIRIAMLNAILAACITGGCGDNQTVAEPDAGAPDPDGGGVPAQPALRFYDFVQAIDVTPDGRTALFGDILTADGRLWFVDTVTNETVNRANVGDPLRAFATGIAQTGS